jgi:hypothetical protein
MFISDARREELIKLRIFQRTLGEGPRVNVAKAVALA